MASAIAAHSSSQKYVAENARFSDEVLEKKKEKRQSQDRILSSLTIPLHFHSPSPPNITQDHVISRDFG